MKLLSQPINRAELAEMSNKMFGKLVKAVVDIEKRIMVIDADLHADEEQYLLESGSLQKNLWGINLYPTEKDEAFIEFDSMINIRPTHNNFSRSVDNLEIRNQIIDVVKEWIKDHDLS